MAATTRRRPKAKTGPPILAIVGYFLAALFPVLGLVMAVVLVWRREYGHAAAVFLVAMISFVVRLAMVSSAGTY